MPIEYTIPQCQHIRTNGTRCGSPALKKKSMCFYHNRMVQPQQLGNIPCFEDADAIQFALWKVVRGVLTRYIDTKDAGRVLYALQIASTNLKQTRNQPYWKNVERFDPLDAELEASYAAQQKSVLEKISAANQAQPIVANESKAAG